MGLFFAGRSILEGTVLAHLLGKNVIPIPLWSGSKSANYEVDHFNAHERTWIWTNLITGKTIITGDEGNSWQIELAQGPSRQAAIANFRKKYDPKGGPLKNFFKQKIKGI